MTIGSSNNDDRILSGVDQAVWFVLEHALCMWEIDKGI